MKQAIPLLLLLSATCGAPAMRTCDRLEDALAAYDFQFDVGPTEKDACGFDAAAPTTQVTSSGDPATSLRTWFGENGWKEVLSRGADGPGTTSFVFTRGDLACEVSGGAPSYLDGGEIVVADKYSLAIRCVRDSDAD